MGAEEMLEQLGKSLGFTATAKSVFGDPIQVDGKTVSSSTRFVPFHDMRWLAAAFCGGVVFGALISLRRNKSIS
jgi:hypothetical protein